MRIESKHVAGVDVTELEQLTTRTAHNDKIHTRSLWALTIASIITNVTLLLHVMQH